MAKRAAMTCQACQGYILFSMEMPIFTHHLEWWMNAGCCWCDAIWKVEGEEPAPDIPTVVLTLHIPDNVRPMLRLYHGDKLVRRIP